MSGDHSQAEVEDMILGMCRNGAAKGIRTAAVKEKLDLLHVAPELRMRAINNLTDTSRMVLHQDPKDAKNTVFKLPSQAELSKYRGLTSEDMLVYQEIGQTGNKGIWQKDLRYKTNLQQAQMTKSLKALEGKGLIKSVKTAASGPRKVFMLADMQPDTASSIEIWHRDGELDEGFISDLRELCYMIIVKSKDTTLEELAQAARTSGAVKVDLRDEHYLHIVQTLELDGKISMVTDGEGVEHFRRAHVSLPPSTAVTNIPCGTCPVFQECTEGGVISPSTCVYYKEWLQF